MQIHDFVNIYQAQSNEELLQLATAREELTPEARLALESELSRRQISIGEPSGRPRNDDDTSHALSNEKTHIRGPQAVSGFVGEVLRTYHGHFWLFFKITAPGVLIGTVGILAARNESREILRHLPRGAEMLTHHTQILKMSLVNLSGWIVSWMAFSCVFGATCIALEESVSGFLPLAWRSFLHIREAWGAFLRLSLVLFMLALLAVVVAMLLGMGVILMLYQWSGLHTRLWTTVVSFGLSGSAFLVLSRFALAIPAVLLDDCGVAQAMYRSVRLTQGMWLTLAALLAKSLIGGYVAGMMPFWLASYLPVTASLPSWFPWILTVLSIIGVTVVEPTMFVGFSLLYLKASALDSEPSRIPTGRLA